MAADDFDLFVYHRRHDCSGNALRRILPAAVGHFNGTLLLFLLGNWRKGAFLIAFALNFGEVGRIISTFSPHH
jgi:hypothetical protein